MKSHQLDEQQIQVAEHSHMGDPVQVDTVLVLQETEAVDGHAERVGATVDFHLNDNKTAVKHLSDFQQGNVTFSDSFSGDQWSQHVLRTWEEHKEHIPTLQPRTYEAM